MVCSLTALETLSNAAHTRALLSPVSFTPGALSEALLIAHSDSTVPTTPSSRAAGAIHPGKRFGFI